MKLISVNERLPEHNQEVLAQHKNGDMFVLVFAEHEKIHKRLKELGLPYNENDPIEYSFSSKEKPGMVLDDVVYWAPLPKPQGLN